MMKNILSILLISGLLLGLGCNSVLDSDSVGSEQLASSAQDLGAIDFGNSISGIKIGDDSTTVIRILGRPSAVGIGDFDGYSLLYAIADSNAIEVTISQNPALGLGVISMDVFSTYSGTTRNGVGIGTLREESLEQLGAPDATEQTSDGSRDIYQFEGSSFVVTYKNDKILSISMTQPLKH